MKRSTQIGLAAAGVVMVATVWSLYGDDSPKEDLVYSSLGECRSGKDPGLQACEAAFAEASATRLREAPRFRDRVECEAVYGAGSCSDAVIDNRLHVLPALAGFMLARKAGGGYQAATPLLTPTVAACPPAARRPGSGRPECEPPRNAAAGATSAARYAGGGGGGMWRSYSTTSGRGITAQPTVVRRAAQTAASRGGFGATSRSYGSRISS